MASFGLFRGGPHAVLLLVVAAAAAVSAVGESELLYPSDAPNRYRALVRTGVVQRVGPKIVCGYPLVNYCKQ